MSEENLPAVADELTPSKWAASLNIPEVIIQEVKLFSQMGWALDGSGKSRALTPIEQKFLSLKCHQSGLSLAAGHMIFLGTKLYVTIAGKRAAAMKDPVKPYFRAAIRPATKEERELYGISNNDPKLPKLFEHLWYAEIFALIGGKEVLVGADYGHASYANINLRGKDTDTVHLCADMAKTRAQGRALSQSYDFFGLDGYEEVGTLPTTYEIIEEPQKSLTERLKDKALEIETVPAQVPPPPPVQEQTESGDNTPAPEDTGSGPADEPVFSTNSAPLDTPTQTPSNKGEVTVQDVLLFIEENKDVLPPADRSRFTEAKLKRYKPEALAISLENLRKEVARANSKARVPETATE